MAAQWLCLRVPQLPLEIFSRSGSEALPLAVCGGERGALQACNAAARAQGVQPGMAVSAARALLHELIVHPRDAAGEQQALHNLAAWAYQFSSEVSLYPPLALLLEIQGSLKLFGGYERLLQRVQSGVEVLGYTAQLASAPTPLAAYSLACCQRQQRVRETSQLAAVLAPLPLSVLDWEQGLLDRLDGMGVRRLGDLFRLPRDGLARRLGTDSLLYLDRLLGRCPHPQKNYRPPPRFRQRLLLPAEVQCAERLLFVLRRLVLEMCGWLRARGKAAQQLEIDLWHRERRRTRLSIGVHQKTRDAEQFVTLVQERLQRVVLQQPVLEVELRVDQVLDLDAHTADLFAGPPEPQVDLLDRLRARLGTDAVRGLSAVAEHRPEYAWRYSEPGHSEQSLNDKPRPLWLLPVPRQLQSDNGWPCLQGRLQLEKHRERIESGWWDGEDMARDYFIARSPSGSCYWIYRELDGERRWFLQGVFE